MRYCSSCGAQVAEECVFCPACGKSVSQTTPAGATTAAAPAPGATTGMADNIAGMLAYFTVIPAIVLLLIAPYNKRRFIRFHAFQCIFLVLACIAASFALRIVALTPVMRWSVLLLWPALSLAELIVWILCVIKAYQGQMFKLPFIGDLAEKQAGEMPVDPNQIKAA